jgi:hypothetical protein
MKIDYWRVSTRDQNPQRPAREGSPLALAITAVILAMAGGAIAGASVLTGVSLGFTVAGFLAPAALFFLIFLVVRLADRRERLVGLGRIIGPGPRWEGNRVPQH